VLHLNVKITVFTVFIQWIPKGNENRIVLQKNKLSLE